MQAVRELWGNTGPAPADAALPLQHPVISTVIWTVLLTAVLAPLSLRAFRHGPRTEPEPTRSRRPPTAGDRA